MLKKTIKLFLSLKFNNKNLKNERLNSSRLLFFSFPISRVSKLDLVFEVQIGNSSLKGFLKWKTIYKTTYFHCNKNHNRVFIIL
ncbi:hypothetical protein C4M95_02135 [Mycoplasmopsis pullorum]|nr:hypothetical protein C4M81_03185 [Mycoplasmopsis pullorum]TNK98054.1 hypothetical protein C4M95_02135 [Mycoplasmopsis pullorum]